MSEVTRAEATIARTLRSLLKDVTLGNEVEGFRASRELQLGLENFLGSALREVHPYWRKESFDGFQWYHCRKSGADEIEACGLAILISDQTLVAIHILLQVTQEGDEIVRLLCKVGESGDGPGNMSRLPYNSGKAGKKLVMVADNRATIDWAYVVGFGEHGPSL